MKPRQLEAGVREIILDASRWRTDVDLIEAVIKGLEGPDWHGRNYNALYDSIVGGSINSIEPPYEFVFTHFGTVNAEVGDAIRYFREQIMEWRARDRAEINLRVEV